MDGSKFFQAWNNFLGLFRAANMQSQNNNAPSENPEARRNEPEQHEQPADTKVPSGDDSDKHSDVRSSNNNSDADLPGDTNITEPDNDMRSDPTPRNNGGIAQGFKVFCRGALDSVVVKVGMAVSQVKDFISNAIQTIKEKGMLGAAKEVGKWMKAHPREMALIFVPLVAMAITAITLLAIGFGPAGVAAGSTAAIIQAGIGNVVAHSLFATCTSAMMGGYGALIIFGGVWFSSTVAIAATSSHVSKAMNDAVDNLMFASTLGVAYITYRIKSWLQSRRRPKSD